MALLLAPALVPPWVLLWALPLALLDGDQEAQQGQTKYDPPAPKPKQYTCADAFTGDYSFTNKTDRSVRIRLYPASTPTEYLGNPGMTGDMITLTAYETKWYFNLPAGVYKYWIMETGDVKRGQRLEQLGQIKVETCQKLNADVKE